jgi:membrane-associated phospholipid phosphatase
MRRRTAATACTVALAVLAAFADRPIARWFGASFYGTALEHAFYLGLQARDWLLPLAGVALIMLAISLRARPDVPWLRRLVSAGASTAAALVATEAIKIVVGRSQVWPQFLQYGLYALRPFAHDPGFMSFPSGTMAGTTAFIAGLHLRPGIERGVAAVVIVFFTFVLFVTGGHWASDILGGTILGLWVGHQVARRFFAEPSRS